MEIHSLPFRGSKHETSGWIEHLGVQTHLSANKHKFFPNEKKKYNLSLNSIVNMKIMYLLFKLCTMYLTIYELFLNLRVP